MLTNMANNSSVVVTYIGTQLLHLINTVFLRVLFMAPDVIEASPFGGASLTVNFQYFSGLRSLLHRKDDNFILFSVS